MRKKKYLRLVFSVSAACLVGFLVLVGGVALTLSFREEGDRVEQLRQEALSIAASLQQTDKGQNYSDEIKRMASAFSNLNDSTVFFVNRSGLVSVCSDTINHKDCPHVGLTLDENTLHQVFFKGRYESTGDFGGVYRRAYHTAGGPTLVEGAG